MMMNERQVKIVKHVEIAGFVTIELLSREFNVSTQTIRRDIIHLDNLNIIKRFHGGAGLPGESSRMRYGQKKVSQVDGKQRIGEAAASLIPDGASVFLDVGTTSEAVAHALARRKNLHIVTNSLFAASAFADNRDIKVAVTGGMLHGPDGSLVGGEVNTALLSFKFDIAIIACSGFDSDGAVMDFDIQKVGIKQAVMKNARRTILIADGTKFVRSAFIRVSALQDFSCMVTDTKPSTTLKTTAQKGGVQLMVV